MRTKNASSVFTAVIILLFSLGLVLFPAEATKSARDALTVCINSVIPSLFPFFVVSRLITGLRYTDFFGRVLNRVVCPLFGTGSASSAFILGITGGYPIGAATCVSLYKSNLCSKEESEHLLAFCNNSGPAFIIGAVGVGIYSSVKLGTLLFLIHVLAAITVGILFRLFSPIKCHNKKQSHHNTNIKLPFHSIFIGAVSGALSSCLSISAYIVLFSAFVSVLNQFNILPLLSLLPAKLFNVDSSVISALLSGVFEVTVGTYSLAACNSLQLSFILTAFLLGWGGLSVHCQTLGILDDSGISASRYFPGKFLHGVISAFYAVFFSPFISEISVPTMATRTYLTDFPNISVCIFLLGIAIIIKICKKSWKTEKK